MGANNCKFCAYREKLDYAIPLLDAPTYCKSSEYERVSVVANEMYYGIPITLTSSFTESFNNHTKFNQNFCGRFNTVQVRSNDFSDG